MSSIKHPDYDSLVEIPLPNLAIEDVKNCIVTRSSLVVTALGLHRSCLNPDLAFVKRVQMSFVGALSVLKNKLYRLDEGTNYYFAFHPWGTGYYHFLMEIAAKFVLFENELRKGEILIPANAPSFVTDFLSLLGFDNTRTLKGNTFVSKLKVISNPLRDHFHIDHLSLLRQRILANINTSATRPNSRLYISRKLAKARFVVNEEPVVDALKPLGFEIVQPEEFSFLEQVQMFRNCDFLISIHGAGLTNILFMPENATVIELYPDIVRRKEDLYISFFRLATILGQHHRYVYCVPVSDSGAGNGADSNIRVDIAKLSAVVEGMTCRSDG